MYNYSRKFSAARKRMADELIALGWTEHPCRFKSSVEFDIHIEYKTPHIDNSLFWFENCLKKINAGEAYYALEMRSHSLSHLAWRCNGANPNNHSFLDTLDAFEMAREMMLHGLDFNYYAGREDEIPEYMEPEDYSGHIHIIDWEHPERNTFEFVQGWNGGLPDGFGWDFVLFVNAIPVGAIILEADYKDSEQEPCQKALDEAQHHLDCDFQFPVYCHSMLLSNGKQMLYGSPWVDLPDFKPISTLAEKLKPTDYLERSIRTMEDIC